MSETFFMGALLALVGGFLDAYTYLCRGGVFANAQTGNLVLLAVRLAEGEWRRALAYLAPVVTFSLGVLLVEAIRRRLKTARLRLHWRQLAVVLELALLLGTALVPRGALDPVVNLLVSFVCAVQVESFRKVGGNAVATTMCTGNLRSGTELLSAYLATGDRGLLRRSGQYFGVIAFFLLGAAAGTLTAEPMGIRAVLVPCGLLAVAFAAMFVRADGADKQREREEERDVLKS